MKSLLSISAFALLALNGAQAFANCSDTVIADCGDFELVSTVCPKVDKDGEFHGAEKRYLTASPKSGASEISLKIRHLAEEDRFSGKIDENHTLVVTSQSEVIKGGRKDVIRTYVLANHVNKGRVTVCKDPAPVTQLPTEKKVLAPPAETNK